jgi:hypothetical protein
MKKTILLTFLLAALVASSPPARAQYQPNTQSITAASSNCTTTPAGCASIALNPTQTAAVTLTTSGTFAATLQFEVLADNVEANKSAVTCYPPNSTSGVTSTTAAGTWTCNVPGAMVFRVRASSYTSGTAVVVLNVSNRTLAVASSSGSMTGAQIATAVQTLTGCNTAGFVFTPQASDCVTASGTGTVTSVALTMPSWMTVGGSPITTAGTLAVTPTAAQTSHQVIGTCGSGTTFVPCTLVAGDLPNIPLTSGVTGILPPVNGGTGVNNGTATLTLGTSNVNLGTLATGFVFNTTTTGAFTAATGTQLSTLAQTLTGCNTAGFVYTPQANDCVAASSGSPGGSTTQLQYNNGGAFGGIADLTFDSSHTLTLGAAGIINLTAGSVTVATQTAGDSSTKGASTAFVTTAVNNAIAGVNPAVAVLAASTANLTGTYTSVASGIGDTFTVTATGTFSLDGIAINTIGQRVLLKNQTDATQNGVYTATVVGAVAVSPVFTRALDYDQPSDVNSTGAIPVQSGTVNTTTSWLLTSNITSIGPAGSAFTYTQFSINPTTIATGYSIPSGCDQFGSSWAAQTVSNTTTPTTMFSCTIPAGYLGQNQVLVIDFSGIITTGGTAGVLTITATYGGQNVCTTPTGSPNTITSSLTNPKLWTFHCEVIGTAAVGTSVAVNTTGAFAYATAVSTGVTWQMANTSTVAAVNTSASGTLALVLTWGTAQSTNSITGQIARVHREN